MQKTQPIYIDTLEQLEKAHPNMKQCKVLAVDTEFHRETTYYPEFALLQIYGQGQCWIIDPIVLKDLSLVWDIFCDEQILKVFHAGRQDLEIILKESGYLPSPIFDTQIAAALLGLGQQIGFGNLVQRLLKKVLPKQESFSDWVSRPLREKQIEYAADDVIWLMPIYQSLHDSLEARGRLTWLQEEQAKLCSLETYQETPDKLMWRVKGSNKLKGLALVRLRALAVWREEQSQKRNIPRRRMIADEPLLEIARRDTVTMDVLFSIRGLSQGFVRRFGQDIIVLCKACRDTPESEWPSNSKRKHPTEGTDLRLELLGSLLRLQAKDGDISAAILCHKSDLSELASWGRQCKQPEPDVACLHGWRRELVGEQLLRLLRGEISLGINPKTGEPVVEVRSVS
ncbi:MAG: ribonuclease D [Mariprofundaceae bacterium]|nr:ribonuclease D [Mariprofundaceae bacterium]